MSLSSASRCVIKSNQSLAVTLLDVLILRTGRQLVRHGPRLVPKSKCRGLQALAGRTSDSTQAQRRQQRPIDGPMINEKKHLSRDATEGISNQPEALNRHSVTSQHEVLMQKFLLNAKLYASTYYTRWNPLTIT